MKRNVFCLLMALMLVMMAMFAMTTGVLATEDDEILVPTSEPAQAEPHTHCVCGGEFNGQHGHTCEAVTFDKVLVVADGENVKVGAPAVEGVTVTAKVEKQGKAKKIYVFKMKRKKNYRRKKGHRQPFTKVTIEKINF